ncbi:MAG: ABC transporter ATP-binding protein [Ilumatobacteraceae bacterium]
MAQVRLEHVTKSFGEGTDAVKAVDDVSIDVEDHDFMILLGPSGCGKSTMLRMVAGLETPTSGDIFIGNTKVNDVAPKMRDVAMVFQSYALYPHKTAQANIEFPLKVRGESKIDRAAKAKSAAEALGLSAYLDRKPGQLSGGQRQRVALARAIVRQPAVFCMDEPLSNLDAKLRGETRAELVDLHRRLDATIIYVTHDQVEAMTMGTRVAVMNHGQLQQIGTPQEVYARPETVFVATFIGTPPMNVMPAGLFERSEALVGVRPEHLRVTTNGGGLRVSIRMVEQLGHETLLVCDASGTRIVVRQGADVAAPPIGAEIGLDAAEAHRHRFDPVTQHRIDNVGVGA